MREFNPTIQSPGDVLAEMRQLRAYPEEHTRAVQTEMARAVAKVEVLSAIADPSTATTILHAYAVRTAQLLEAEANQTRGELDL